MNRSPTHPFALAAAAFAAGIGTMLLLRPDAAIGAERAGSSDLPSCTLSGKLTVELALDPSTGPANAGAWTGPLKDVDEIILFDKWAVLRKRDLGTDGSLVVPREKIVFINIGH